MILHANREPTKHLNINFNLHTPSTYYVDLPSPISFYVKYFTDNLMCAELTNVYAVQAHADHFLPMSDEEIRKFTGIRILMHSFIYPRVGFVLAA